MDTLEAIMTRRSVRHFTTRPVTEAELEPLLRAAMAAPSASNEQSWRFVIVRDRERIERLSRATPFARAAASAQLVVVVCADRPKLRYPWFWVIDCAAAIQNLLLATHATGLGAVWIGVHPIAPFRSAVRKVIEAPVTVVPHSMIAVGHPADALPAVDRFKPEFIHSERW